MDWASLKGLPNFCILEIAALSKTFEGIKLKLDGQHQLANAT